MEKLPFEEELRKKLAVSGYYGVDAPPESIMDFGRICDHDDAYLCECRLNWLIKYLEEQWSRKHTHT